MPCTLVPTLASPPVPDPKFRPRPFFEQCLTLATPPHYRTESRSSDPTSVPHPLPLSLHLRRAQTSGWGAGVGVGLSAKPQRVRKARLTPPHHPTRSGATSGSASPSGRGRRAWTAPGARGPRGATAAGRAAAACPPPAVTATAPGQPPGPAAGGAGRAVLAPHSPCPISLPSTPISRPTIGGKYCLGERRRHRSCNTDVSPPRIPSRVPLAPLTRGKRKAYISFQRAWASWPPSPLETCSGHPLLSRTSLHQPWALSPSNSSHFCSRCVSHLEITAWPLTTLSNYTRSSLYCPISPQKPCSCPKADPSSLPQNPVAKFSSPACTAFCPKTTVSCPTLTSTHPPHSRRVGFAPS